MSNYGLEKFLLNNKIKFLRSKVGDRYVKELMQKNEPFPVQKTLR